MRTLINKLIAISILCSFVNPAISGPEAWGKLFGKVAGTAGAGGAGICYMAHNHPQTLDRAVAFKRAMFGQYAPVVSQPTTMNDVAQTALQTRLLDSLTQSQNAHASQMKYQQRKDIVMYSTLIVGSVVAIDYFSNGKIRRAITKAKDEIKDYVGEKFSQLSGQIKTLGRTLGQKIDNFRSWTANRFNKVDNKLAEQNQQLQQIQQSAQVERQQIATAVNTGNQRTHQMLDQVLLRLPHQRNNSMEEVE